MKIKKVIFKLFLPVFCFVSFNSIAGPGDTTVVQFFTFSSARDSIVMFPSDTNSYERILMYYTLKCNPAQNPPCGEWDYITYTILYDHTGQMDSVKHMFPNFIVNNNTPDSFMFMNQPTWKYQWKYQYFNQTPMTDSAVVGTGNQYLPLPMNSVENDAKILFLWKASELIGANLTSGDITAIRFNLSSIGGELKNLRIRLKHTFLDSLTSSNVPDTGYTLVYDKHTLFGNTGWNSVNFTYPFQWNGSSNIVIEFSYSKNLSSTQHIFMADTMSYIAGLSSNNQDYFLKLDNSDNVKIGVNGLSGIDSTVTISFWTYGDSVQLPKKTTLFHAVDSNNRKVLNVHLPWNNGNIYWDAGNNGTTSYDRINKSAASSEYKGRWNHWAFTKDVGAGEMKIYLNGLLWHSGTGKTKVINTISRFSIGSNVYGSNPYCGLVDEFRVWDVALNSSEINNWMYKMINQSHPKYSNLVAYYRFNEGTGLSTVDESANNDSAFLFGIPEWKSYEGKNRFRDFDATNLRPNVIFEKGNYNAANIDSTFVLDSVNYSPVAVVLYEDTVHPNTNIPTDTIIVWPAYYNNYIFDSLGNAIDSALVMPDSVLHKSEHPYWDPPLEIIYQYELGRFITPYGNGLDLGDGFTWVFDVTDFRPLLKDMVHIKAGNWQELLDLKFVMIEGTPDRDVLDIKKLWSGTFNLSNIDQTITPVTLKLDSAASMFSVKTTTSGHAFSNPTNCAEFCPKIQSVKVGNSVVASWQIIQECADNPLYPQGGTWIYDRAGWCPGAKVSIRNVDITPYVTPGDSATIDYNSQTDPYGNYRFKAYLVSYGSPNFNNNAAIEEILAPNDMKFYGRMNPICGRPKIKIRNAGANILTNLTFTYGPEGASQTYQWTGSLEFNDTAYVTLDPIDWTNWNENKRFIVSVSNPNGVVDEYPFNDIAHSSFELPTDLPNVFQFWLKTNSFGYETSYVLSDAYGNIIYKSDSVSGSLTNNTWYKDTFSLANGCYSLIIYDSDDDGISFWANNDGSGSATIRKMNNQMIKFFEPDFGKEITFNFTVGSIIGVEEYTQKDFLKIFPNPTNGIINIAFALEKRQDVLLDVRDLMGKLISTKEVSNAQNEVVKINLQGLKPGIYFCSMITKSGVTTQKVVLSR